MKINPNNVRGAVRRLRKDVRLFAALGSHLKLRRYQEVVAEAVVDSVLGEKGYAFVVMFPRQSGKNELQAQIEAFLLARYFNKGGEIVKVSPTWKPQSVNAMRRLERTLNRNFITRNLWKKEWGYIYKMGEARVFFLSGAKTAHIVGATASLLLEVDEAQDVEIGKYDKEIGPMAASTNATRVFWGTAWTKGTLLGRELQAARELERADGVRRVFHLTADEVTAEAPAYGKFVQEQIAKLGREHPLVRSQFFSEAIDMERQLFPARRRAIMQGEHTTLDGPQTGGIYALLLDVAGEEEGLGEAIAERLYQDYGQRRDATALTVAEVDLTTTAGVTLPIYRVVQRYAWVGEKQTALFDVIRGLAEHWQARRVVVDATGVGAGLASFLEQALPTRVRRFVFSQQSKSKLGWDFLSVVETGRYKEYRPSPNSFASLRTGSSPQSFGKPQDKPSIVERGVIELQRRFWREVEACEFEVLTGPGKLLRWGVPDGRRDEGSGELIHDDLLVSAALCARLDEETWGRAVSVVIPPADPWGGKW